MISPPSGWIQIPAVSSLVYQAPQGRHAGLLRYLPQTAPLQSLATWVAALLAEDPSWRAITLHPRREFTTMEGEYAFLQVIDGECAGIPSQRCIGLIATDYCADVLDLSTSESALFSEHAELAQQLLYKAVLGLGVRRRRFLYTMPPGWVGHPTGLVTNWYPASYPREATTLLVYPANPQPGAQPAAVLQDMLEQARERGRELHMISPAMPIESRYGLRGLHFEFTGEPLQQGRPLSRDLIVYHCHTYLYSLQLDTYEPRPEYRQSLLLLAHSVQPLPTASAPTSRPFNVASSSLFNHLI